MKIIGRITERVKRFGKECSVPIGSEIILGNISKEQNIYLDVSKPQIVIICGKRGTGKSYTMGKILEGLASLDQKYLEKTSVILIDTMGIFYGFRLIESKDDKVNEIQKTIKIYVPKGIQEEYSKNKLTFDDTFAFFPSEITIDEWCQIFEIDRNTPTAILFERILEIIKRNYDKSKFGLEEMELFTRTLLSITDSDDKREKRKFLSQYKLKNANANLLNPILARIQQAADWKIFAKEGHSTRDCFKPGQITILDISLLPNLHELSSLRSSIIALLLTKMFEEKKWIKRVSDETSLFNVTPSKTPVQSLDDSIIWLFMDEVQQFFPSNGGTPSTPILSRIVLEGRQPGFGLVIATQQPGKIHNDAITQSDILIAHKLDSKQDIQKLNDIKHSFMDKTTLEELRALPDEQGVAFAIDGKTMSSYQIQIGARLFPHFGTEPDLLDGDITPPEPPEKRPIILARRHETSFKHGSHCSVPVAHSFLESELCKKIDINIDVSKPGVYLICGHRGMGKTYTMGTIIEGIGLLPQEFRENICTLIIDTMGIFYPFRRITKLYDKDVMKQLGLSIEQIEKFQDSVKIFIPESLESRYKENNLKYDSTFSFVPWEITIEDWASIFDFDPTSAHGILFSSILKNLKDNPATKNFSIDMIIQKVEEIMEWIEDDEDKAGCKEYLRKNKFDNAKKNIIDPIRAKLYQAKEWKIFSEKGVPVSAILTKGQITILDISLMTQAGTINLKEIIVGLFIRKIYEERRWQKRIHDEMEFKNFNSMAIIEKESKEPVIWLFVDEIHQFFPASRKTPATSGFSSIILEGRQPGFGVVMATQSPGKLHPDALSQSDLIISHKLDTKSDIESLNEIKYSFMGKETVEELKELKSEPGWAFILDGRNSTVLTARFRKRLCPDAGEGLDLLKQKRIGEILGSIDLKL